MEFALVLPVLALLVCGIADFGRAFHDRIALTHAAREGARVWALTEDTTKTDASVKNASTSVPGVTWTSTACTFGTQTSVTVKAPFSYITPMIANLAPSITELTATGVMRCEH